MSGPSNITRLALPDSAKDPALECPWSGVAVPVQQGQKVSFVMQRAACSIGCALYDRARKLPGCVVDLRPALDALVAAVKGAGHARA